MQVFIKTYGCRMNERDSDAVLALLRDHGYTAAAGEAEADVLIVNTCSVRGKAEDKAVGKLGLLAAGKRARSGRIVGAIGCMAQRRAESLLATLPGLDFVVGTHRMDRLPSVLEAVRRGAGPVVDTAVPEAGGRPDLAGHPAGRIVDSINVLYGCDRRCAYCVVPLVRGREWSRPMADIESEARRLVGAGVREIALLGQSVLRYGIRQAVDTEAGRASGNYREPFPRLLERLAGIPGLLRIRFASGHPEGCTPELARAMRDLPPVCEHLHLPMQSGSDRILELMGRGYTADRYRAAVLALRAAVPGLALSTDVIVGFPTEDEADFEKTRALMAEIGFDNAFIFKYSPRPGSRAAGMRDDVSDGEKRRRNRILLEDQNARCREIYRRRAGSVQQVLAEGPSARNPARWSGRTRDNKIVLFEPAPGVVPGDLVSVGIEKTLAQTLYGAIEGKPKEA